MADITVKTVAGKDAGTVALDEAIFAVQPNVSVMHQVVTAQLANRRAGTQSTKTRPRCAAAAPSRTARRAPAVPARGRPTPPHFSGGGIALGPKPRSYRQRTPKKMIRLALHSALSDRTNEGKVVVIDSWGLEAPKTKDAAAAIAALGLEGRVLVVLDRNDTNAALSFRNLPEVQIIHTGELNAYDVLSNDYIVFTKATLEAVNAGPTSASSPPMTRRPPSVSARCGQRASRRAEPADAAGAQADVSESSSEPQAGFERARHA